VPKYFYHLLTYVHSQLGITRGVNTFSFAQFFWETTYIPNYLNTKPLWRLSFFKRQAFKSSKQSFCSHLYFLRLLLNIFTSLNCVHMYKKLMCDWNFKRNCLSGLIPDWEQMQYGALESGFMYISVKRWHCRHVWRHMQRFFFLFVKKIRRKKDWWCLVTSFFCITVSTKNRSVNVWKLYCHIFYTL
jgi:hypothetical protein